MHERTNHWPQQCCSNLLLLIPYDRPLLRLSNEQIKLLLFSPGCHPESSHIRSGAYQPLSILAQPQTIQFFLAA